MALEAQNITFRYRRRGSAPVLENVSLVLNPGDRLGLSAPSGRGKTTLCRLLAGYEKPEGGRVLLDGIPLSQCRGFCPVQLLWQHPEGAVDPLLRLKTTLNEAGSVEREVLDSLGIRDSWLERYPSELSGGELQLDLVTQARLWRFLLAQAERRDLGLLVVSHDRQLLKRLCTRVLAWEELTGR